MKLSDLMMQSLAQHASELHVCVPATVESYDAVSQTCDVVPSVGAGQGVISGVPVVWPSCGGMAMTLPMTRGDRVLLVFADSSLDEWWTGRATTPADSRSHARTDCFALPGGRPATAPITNVDAVRAVFGASDSSSPRVAVDNAAVHLGVAHGINGLQSAVRGEAHVQAIKDLVTALDTYLATGITAGPTLVFPPPAIANWIAAKAAFNLAQHTTPKVKLP